MSALDTAKEIVRMGTTAGLSKDVIDLLEKKVGLLVDENTTLSTKVSKLEIENAQLRAKLEYAQPAGLEESMGVLWKRTATGFEPNPYCNECPGHPVMHYFPTDHRPLRWVCSTGHSAPISVRPPAIGSQITGLPPQDEPLEWG